MTQQLLQRLSYRGILAGDGVSARIAHANLAIRPMAPSVALQGSRCIWRRVLCCFIERQLYVHYSPTSKTRCIQAILYPYIINIYMYIYILICILLCAYLLRCIGRRTVSRHSTAGLLLLLFLHLASTLVITPLRFLSL